ncbi:hypothetical protein FRACYDRAFT_261679 [Fragilariopsis cylindrus CCMP1102]|uniref:PiggyBac transposable element-derived protein domain-containing protein n=1 Tax=Fragilariopsis cylindrus CCMP1102 TaxID=635003 RepID=A0A1E7FB67_9STRA|nr:hypothetical protein FRACYDRAFT_261679 [Fragilariopsis cylindrus CCMP1102]|eukprot:OEU15430.1 hypothetical protein FRACYDRAFT_261679 [Fragilariopsis cylindrus CCMP1102]
MAGIVVCCGGLIGMVGGTALYLGLHFGNVPETTQLIVEGVLLGMALIVVCCVNWQYWFPQRRSDNNPPTTGGPSNFAGGWNSEQAITTQAQQWHQWNYGHWMDGIISRDKFEYLWRNISLSEGGDGDSDSIDDKVSDEADGEFVDDNDYVVNNNYHNDDDGDDEQEEEEEEDMKDNNNNNNDDDDGSIDYDTVVDDEQDDEEAFYNKAVFMLDWVNKFSRGFAISIDEMMELFKGRSNMTHIMRCKPIPQGYKFYVMCCATSGFSFFFFPDGLKDNKKRKIHEGVVWCVRHLPDRKKKQNVVGTSSI